MVSPRKTRSKPSASPKRKPSKSPAKKSKSPKKTPAKSREPSKSPGRGRPRNTSPRARSRSVSRSRAASRAGSRPRSPIQKKSPIQKSPVQQTPAKRAPSRSRPQQKTPQTVRKISPIQKTESRPSFSPVSSNRSSLRLRNQNNGKLSSFNPAPRSQLSFCSPFKGNCNIVQRLKAAPSKIYKSLRAFPKRFSVAKTKRFVKAHWKKAVLLAAVGAAAYYSYYNQKKLQKIANEQYDRIARLIEEQKHKDWNIFGNLFETKPVATISTPTPDFETAKPPIAPASHDDL